MRYRVTNSDGDVLHLDDDDSCRARETGDLCGGCDNCLLTQFSHSGCKIEEIDDTRREG